MVVTFYRNRHCRWRFPNAIGFGITASISSVANLLDNFLRLPARLPSPSFNFMKRLRRTTPNREETEWRFYLSYNAALELNFQSSGVTSDARLLLARKLKGRPRRVISLAEHL